MADEPENKKECGRTSVGQCLPMELNLSHKMFCIEIKIDIENKTWYNKWKSNTGRCQGLNLSVPLHRWAIEGLPTGFKLNKFYFGGQNLMQS